MTILSFDRARRVVGRAVLAGVSLCFVSMACAAKPMLTQDEASAMVLANGFKFVAKAEPASAPPASGARALAAASPGWDVWAVKDGIAYRVTIDASTGDLVVAAPAVEDD